MTKSSFPNYLGKALSGVTQVRAGKQMGLGQPTLSKLLKGEKRPNYEHVIKLAVYLNLHPADLFEMAGRPQDAEVCRRLVPQETVAGPLIQRFQRLLRLGMSGDLDEALRRLEILWEANRKSFECLVQDMGCRAACLTAEGVLLYCWNCTESQGLSLAEKRRASGWKGFTYQRSGLDLELFLSGGKQDRGRIDSGLQNWASVFSSVLQRE